VTDTPPQSPPAPRRNFVIYFMGLMFVASAITFVCFTYAARESKAHRREISRRNLRTIHQALMAIADDAQNHGQFPDELQKLSPQYLKDENALSHPSWPDRAGYMYVSDVQKTDPAAETVIVFENVPAGKEKLGRLALTLNGEVHMWSEMEFQAKMTSQEARWKSLNRVWRTTPVEPLTQVK
jgi:hypothetical protein